MRDTYVFRKPLGTPTARFEIELELDPAELQAIGHIVAQWAFLEYHIYAHTAILGEWLGESLPANAESASFRKRKRAWDQIARRSLAPVPEHLDRVLKLIARVGSVEGQRHKLVHGLIQWRAHDKESLSVYTRANPLHAPWGVDVERLESFARKIAILNADLLNVHNENPDIPEIAFALRRRPGTPVRMAPDHGSGVHHKSSPAVRKPPK